MKLYKVKINLHSDPLIREGPALNYESIFYYRSVMVVVVAVGRVLRVQVALHFVANASGLFLPDGVLVCHDC